MCACTTRETPAQLGFGVLETTMRAVRRLLVVDERRGLPVDLDLDAAGVRRPEDGDDAAAASRSSASRRAGRRGAA